VEFLFGASRPRTSTGATHAGQGTLAFSIARLPDPIRVILDAVFLFSRYNFRGFTSESSRTIDTLQFIRPDLVHVSPFLLLVDHSQLAFPMDLADSIFHQTESSTPMLPLRTLHGLSSCSSNFSFQVVNDRIVATLYDILKVRIIHMMVRRIW